MRDKTEEYNQVHHNSKFTTHLTIPGHQKGEKQVMFSYNTHIMHMAAGRVTTEMAAIKTEINS